MSTTSTDAPARPARRADDLEEQSRVDYRSTDPEARPVSEHAHVIADLKAALEMADRQIARLAAYPDRHREKLERLEAAEELVADQIKAKARVIVTGSRSEDRTGPYSPRTCSERVTEFALEEDEDTVMVDLQDFDADWPIPCRLELTLSGCDGLHGFDVDAVAQLDCIHPADPERKGAYPGQAAEYRIDL